MKVFISWSGQLSKEVGEVFRNWLPSVLQVVKPYFTPDDVEKGARWSSEIAGELEASQIGIILLTKENLDSLWISFEAGALSKQMDKSQICTILFGIDNTDLKGPLVQFQSTSFDKAEIKKLVKTVNSACGEQKLTDTVLGTTFEMWWPKLKDEIADILKKYKGQSSGMQRDDRDILEEILTLSRITAEGRTERTIDKINPKAIEDLIGRYSFLKNKLPPRYQEQFGKEFRDVERIIDYLLYKTGRGHISWIPPKKRGLGKVSNLAKVEEVDLEEVDL